jgi:hypothetical protein
MGRFDEILERSAEKTDKELASEISSFSRLTDNEITTLFPQRSDQEKLLKLLAIVQGATAENEKIDVLKTNIEELAGTALKLIKFVL